MAVSLDLRIRFDAFSEKDECAPGPLEEGEIAEGLLETTRVLTAILERRLVGYEAPLDGVEGSPGRPLGDR